MSKKPLEAIEGHFSKVSDLRKDRTMPFFLDTGFILHIITLLDEIKRVNTASA
jgi:hypothetical protein